MRNSFKKAVFWIIQKLAKLVLKKYNPKIIAVTGSVGKTSSKEAIHRALSAVFYIGKNQKSYNSEIGIPLAVLGVDSGWNSPIKWLKNILEGLALLILPNFYPRWLVVEAGVDHPGDMDFTNSLIKSDIAVFTKFAETPVHVEFFKTPQEVMEEKKKLVKSLKEDGVLVLNFDDKEVLKIKEGSGKHAITFGFDDGADVRATNLEIFYEEDKPAGINFKINIEGKSFPVMLKGVLGVQHVYPILGALAVGVALKQSPLRLIETFKGYMTLPGRMRLLDGVFGSTIIDDTYNSSPVAVEEALKTLGSIESGRKIAVLGDMAELGEFTEKEHRRIGDIVLDRADILIAVGKKARFIALEAERGGVDRERIHVYDNGGEVKEFLKNFIKTGDIILIKGSQSARLEKVVKEILAKPEDAYRLLVRQEEVWNDR